MRASNTNTVDVPFKPGKNWSYIRFRVQHYHPVQPADIGWPTGNGEKLSNSQACCQAHLCLAAALCLSISCGQSYVRRLYGRGVTITTLRGREIKFGRNRRSPPAIIRQIFPRRAAGCPKWRPGGRSAFVEIHTPLPLPFVQAAVLPSPFQSFAAYGILS